MTTRRSVARGTRRAKAFGSRPFGTVATFRAGSRSYSRRSAAARQFATILWAHAYAARWKLRPVVVRPVAISRRLPIRTGTLARAAPGRAKRFDGMAVA